MDQDDTFFYPDKKSVESRRQGVVDGRRLDRN